MPFYERNPSVPQKGELRVRAKVVPLVNGERAMVVNATGEILGSAQATYVTTEEVDQTRFVKLFLDGIRQTVGLSKAGLAVFEIVYAQMRENPGVDQVTLTQFGAGKVGVPARTYQRGVRDLVEREFLFCTPAANIFFVNIQFMFNGNRLNFIKSFHLKDSREPSQTELDLDASPQLGHEA
jgi:hypothetical protein